MSYIIFLASITMYVLYFALKYAAYRPILTKRPVFKEVWRYNFENNERRGRNAKAFKYVAISLILIGIISLPFTPSLSTELRDISFATTILKMLMLLIGGVNFMARNVLYEEEHKGDKKFSIPLLEIVDVFRKTNWFARGGDSISVVVNLTTISLIVVLISLLYVTFF